MAWSSQIDIYIWNGQDSFKTIRDIRHRNRYFPNDLGADNRLNNNFYPYFHIADQLHAIRQNEANNFFETLITSI